MTGIGETNFIQKVTRFYLHLLAGNNKDTYMNLKGVSEGLVGYKELLQSRISQHKEKITDKCVKKTDHPTLRKKSC